MQYIIFKLKFFIFVLFEGVRISQILLANRRIGVWNRSIAPPPILLVCYTNHALDQFLRDLLSTIDKTVLLDWFAFTNGHSSGIVRVGGRCQDKNIEQYTLRAIRDRLLEIKNERYREKLIQLSSDPD